MNSSPRASWACVAAARFRISKPRAARLHEVGAVVLARGRGRGRHHVHDDVERLGVDAQRLALPAVDLARPPLQTIANVGFPELLRRGDADSRERQAVGREEENRVPGKDFAACLVDPDELATLRDPSFLR
jgi:hypothetical protein